MIPTARHLEYVLGYIALGLFDEASDELQRIDASERASFPVARVRVELHMARREWDLVIVTAEPLVQDRPEFHDVWIAWAFALREQQRVAEALDVLQQGLEMHGHIHPIFHYNLACYHCLLGDLSRAREELRVAADKDDAFNAMAASDPDLQALWPELRGRS